MSDIRFRCSACEKKLTVVHSAAGKKVKCPWCTTAIHIPSQSTLSKKECAMELNLELRNASPVLLEQLKSQLSQMAKENRALRQENVELKAKASDSQRLSLDLRDMQEKAEEFDAMARKNTQLQDQVDSVTARLDRYRLELFNSAERIKELEEELKSVKSRKSQLAAPVAHPVPVIPRDKDLSSTKKLELVDRLIQIQSSQWSTLQQACRV